MAIVILYGNLFEKEEGEDAIPKGYFKTDARWTNLSLIFLLLFILWNHLFSLFLAEGAILTMYKEFCSKVWAKCELMLPSNVKFYAQNMYQMRKTRIEVRANITIWVDACKATRLAADDCCNLTIDKDDSNDEADIDSANRDLIEFGVHTKTLSAKNVQKTRCRWAV